MGLKLLRGYVKERYGHEVTEVPNGFAVWGDTQYDGKEVLYVQDFYVSPDNRGLNHSGSRQLFNKLKDIVRHNKWDGITGFVQLDAFNGNDMLRLFLYLGFQAVKGNDTSILLYYKVKDGNKNRQPE